MTNPTTEQPSPEAVARLFHDTYERLAPSFGYETREDTKRFDPDSKNGRLMIAVCSEFLGKSRSRQAERDKMPEDFSTHQVIEEAERSIRRMAKGTYDRDAIREIISNACDYARASERAALRASRQTEHEDTARLEWIESQGNGSSWVARQSVTGRGFRLHNTGKDDSGWDKCRGTARAAIDASRAASSTEKGGTK